jgi:hypothetical protein
VKITVQHNEEDCEFDLKGLLNVLTDQRNEIEALKEAVAKLQGRSYSPKPSGKIDRLIRIK